MIAAFIRDATVNLTVLNSWKQSDLNHHLDCSSKAGVEETSNSSNWEAGHVGNWDMGARQQHQEMESTPKSGKEHVHRNSRLRRRDDGGRRGRSNSPEVLQHRPIVARQKHELKQYMSTDMLLSPGKEKEANTRRGENC